MKFLGFLVLAGVMVSGLGGCAIVAGGNAGVAGSIYSEYKAPGQVGNATGTKTGQACAMSILGLVGIGDASLTEAMAHGQITQIAHVDHENFSVLGVYGRTCTVVTGQ